MRQRLQKILLRDPGTISLVIRWLGWLIAFAIVIFKAAPSENLQGAPLALVVSGCQLLILTTNPDVLRFEFGTESFTRGAILRPLADLSIALWCVYTTGGWNSPFYHFAVTTVLAPSLRYGIYGALFVTGAYTAGFIATVSLTAQGFAPAYLADGHPGPDLISTPLNPLMISVFAAFLGEVLHRLRVESARAEALAAAEERAKMSRDIHDGVAQTLFMLTMSLETGQVLASKEGAQKTSSHLERLTPIARKALLELRNTMHNIEPLERGRQTLPQAVGQLVRDYQSATECALEFEVSADFSPPDKGASDIFRMVQESLANACHHADAQTIKIHLGDPHSQGLSVVDNGRGFDPETVRRGRGLNNLKTRATELDVELRFIPAEPGTRMELSWRGTKN